MHPDNTPAAAARRALDKANYYKDVAARKAKRVQARQAREAERLAEHEQHKQQRAEARRRQQRADAAQAHPPSPSLKSADPLPPSPTEGPPAKFSENSTSPPPPLSQSAINYEVNLLHDIGRFVTNPLGFVKYAFPWGAGDMADAPAPYPWQTEILGVIGNHLSSPATRFKPLKIAVASGKGIGKSALISMLNWWGLSTCEDCRVVVTANTEPQLRTKTLPEMHKWARNALNAHWFNLGATSMTSRDMHPQPHDRTWRSDAMPWNEQNPQAFAGLHNKGKRIIVIEDEASEIADVIWDVIEGALTDEKTEIIWVAFGNPTRNTGRFSECFGKNKHRWVTRQIDSRSVPGTNKAQIQEWVDDYGEDSDFVRIWVRGEFPRAGSSQLIPSDTVELARKYTVPPEAIAHMPKIMAVDVARYGKNQTVIVLRQGRKLRVLSKHRGLDTMQTADKVVEWMGKEEPDAVVVDGDGLGAGVVDRLKQLGYGRRLTEFHGGHKAGKAEAYYNRRAEVWGELRDWLKEGADIPDDPELAADLVGPQYGFSGSNQQIQLERKEDMERRGLSSPDLGDAAAYSFAVTPAVKRLLTTRNLVYDVNRSQLAWMGG